MDADTVQIIRDHHNPHKSDPMVEYGAKRSPQLIQLICVADALTSMTTERAYRAACSTEHALAELRRCAGRQFAPNAVEAAHKLTLQRGAAA